MPPWTVAAWYVSQSEFLLATAGATCLLGCASGGHSSCPSATNALEATRGRGQIREVHNAPQGPCSLAKSRAKGLRGLHVPLLHGEHAICTRVACPWHGSCPLQIMNLHTSPESSSVHGMRHIQGKCIPLLFTPSAPGRRQV